MEIAKEITSALQFFFGETNSISVQPITQGLINQSFKLRFKRAKKQETYFLQSINTSIFSKPNQLMENILCLNRHLVQTNYPYQLLNPISNAAGQYLYVDPTGKHWRVFSYIANAIALEQVREKSQVIEAARAMGEFYKYTQDLPAESMQKHLAHFHELDYYWECFWQELKLDKFDRKKDVEDLLKSLESNAWLVEAYQKLDLPKRVIHGDPKLGNILFDQDTSKVIAIIDWDTLMPGYVLSDFGDMVRTYTNVLGEESLDFENIKVDVSHFQNLTKAFLWASKGFLTSSECSNLYFGALWISFEQSLRFLTDYLAGDVYYKTEYPQHNLQRAKNQVRFLKSLLDFKLEGENYIKSHSTI